MLLPKSILPVHAACMQTTKRKLGAGYAGRLRLRSVRGKGEGGEHAHHSDHERCRVSHTQTRLLPRGLSFCLPILPMSRPVAELAFLQYAGCNVYTLEYSSMINALTHVAVKVRPSPCAAMGMSELGFGVSACALSLTASLPLTGVASRLA